MSAKEIKAEIEKLDRWDVDNNNYPAENDFGQFIKLYDVIELINYWIEEEKR